MKGRNGYGPIPIETAVFADAGVAWTSNERAWFLGGDRKPVKSVGTTVRVGLFGYLALQLDFVWPLDRPDKGWVWQFNFLPGF